MPKRFTKSASVVCPGRIWLTFSCVIVLGYEARIVRQEESRRAATRDLVFISASLYILHKLRRDAAKSFAGWRDCSRSQFVLVMAGVCPVVACRPKPRREEELLRLVLARGRR